LVEFINFHSPIKIICRIHGEFKQSPNNHKKGQGCPSCSESKGEKEIRNFLIKNSILFYPQHKFSDCKNIKELPFDFYIEKHKICIEYNGKQHYEPIEYFGGQENFLKTKKRDKIKKDYCKNNNIKLFIIKYNENINKKLESIFKTKL
jgi:very-short-patch-repair endonuclease